MKWKLTLTFVASIAATVGLLLVSGMTLAQEEELKKAKEFFSTAGIPGDRWIEGETMVPHVAPGHAGFRQPGLDRCCAS